MKAPPFWLRMLSSIVTFFVLAHLLFEYSAGLGYLVSNWFSTIESFFRSEYEGYPWRLRGRTIIEIVAIFSPPLLAAIYIYLHLTRRRFRFSLRALILATTALAMFLAFGRSFYAFSYEHELDSTIAGTGYAVLLLFLGRTFYCGIRELESKDPNDGPPRDS